MTETTVAEATPNEATLNVRHLTAFDRCDKCSSQAFVIAVFPGGAELLFCGHHGRSFNEKLQQQAVIVKSYVDQINSQASPSTSVQ